MIKLKSYAFVLLGAFIYHLGHPNHLDILLPFGSIIGMAILLYELLPTQKTRYRVLKFLTFNLFITLASFYWITKTLQEFGDLPLVVAALANSLYTLIFQPHLWLLIIVLHFTNKRDFNLTDSGIKTFALSIFLTITEYYIPQQFPVFVSHPLITISEYLGLASVFGMPMFSFVCYLLALETVRQVKFKASSKLNWSICLIFIIANPLVSSLRTHNKLDSEDSYHVRMVQPNISNFMKMKSEAGGYASVSYVLGEYKKFSLAPTAKSKKLDLIVWPETAYPYPIDSNKEDFESTLLPPALNDLALEMNSHLLVGGYDHAENSDDNSFFMTEYNSAFFISPEARLLNTYNKHVLIPFGETLPFGPLNKSIGKMIPNIAFFAEGDKFPVFKGEKPVSLITTICYELLRPEFMREYLNSINSTPNLSVNLTNDSWYGNTLEPEQHLFLARWRAIEFNLPILRSTNTGITTYINANGQEEARLEYDIADKLDIEIKLNTLKSLDSSPTLFQRFGIILSICVWFLCFIFHYMLIKFKHAE